MGLHPETLTQMRQAVQTELLELIVRWRKQYVLRDICSLTSGFCGWACASWGQCPSWAGSQLH